MVMKTYSRRPPWSQGWGFTLIEESRWSVFVKTLLLFQDSYQTVYNWQYIQCLHLWCRIVSEVKSNGVLDPLIYPLVQTVLGAIKWVPSEQFPFSFITTKRNKEDSVMFTLKSKFKRVFARFERDDSRSNDSLFQTKSACLQPGGWSDIVLRHSGLKRRQHKKWRLKTHCLPRTGGSVDWASGCHAGGREFDSGRTNT